MIWWSFTLWFMCELGPTDFTYSGYHDYEQARDTAEILIISKAQNCGILGITYDKYVPEEEP